MLRPFILTGPIKPLTVNANLPQPAFGAADVTKEPGNGALEAGNFTAENTSGDGEEPPDFSGLDPDEKEGKTGNPPAVDKTAPKGAEPVQTPPVEEKPATGQPPKAATPPSKGPNEPIPEIPPFKPGQTPPAGKEDHPTDPNRFKDGTFKPGKEPKPGTPPAVTPPAAAPVVTPPVVKPPEPAKPLPKDDADIDAVEPKATASDKTKNDFKALKETAKAARQYAREIEAKLKEAEGKVAGDLPADVKEKLARLDEAEKFKAMFELENEPKAREKYTATLTAAEDKIIKTLTEDPRLGLPKEKAEQLKTLGFDSPEAAKLRNQWLQLIRKNTGDELLVLEVADLFRSRDKVVAERKNEVERLRGDRDAYLSQRQEGEKNEFNGWGAKADARLEKIAMETEWAAFKTAPADATPEQKAFVDAHNKRVAEEIVPKFQADIKEVYSRNPERTIELIFAAHQAENEYKPKIASLEAENAAHVARIAELEALANGVRGASSFSSAEQAPRTPVPSAPLGTNTAAEVGVDEAFAAWEAGKK